MSNDILYWINLIAESGNQLTVSIKKANQVEWAMKVHF